MIKFIKNSNWNLPGRPRYRALAEVLRSGILSGTLPDRLRFPPEAELAAELGINQRTLRAGLKLLAAEHLISQCRGQGTFVTYARKSHLKIGVMMGDPANISDDIYFMRLIAGLSRAAYDIPDGELQFMATPARGKIFDLIHQRECQALIVLDRTRGIARQLCEPKFDSLPVIFLNPSLPGLTRHNRYEVNIAKGAVAEGVRHLFRLGHRRIGFISSRVTWDQRLVVQNREFTDVCAELSISTAYRRLFPGSAWYENARTAARELVLSADRPTALLCPGFNFSCGAWQGVMDAGLSIPRDISLLGFDANVNSNPHMSSFDAPLDRLSAEAVELAFALQTEGKHRKELCREIPRRLVERGSCNNVGSIK